MSEQKKQSILLIEDNPEMRENTAEILELAGYELFTAENGKVGVEIANRIPLDLIISDVMMPELDGFGVLHILSKSPRTARIPFIFLTAKAEKSDFRKGMNLGADDYLTKPFEEVELLDAVESRLKKSRILNIEFENNVEGLQQFLNEARGLKALEGLSSDRETMVYSKKQFIYREGSYPKKLFFIKSGRVRTYKTNEDGKEYVTGLFKAGDFIGYRALLEDSTYSESATAMEDTELQVIPRNDFFSLLYSNRDVSSQFIRMMANALEEKEERLLRLAYDSVRMRVAGALLQLRDRFQTKEDQEKDRNFSMAISREELASIVGTAQETVIRTLSDFKKDKAIEIRGSNITILDPEELRRTSGQF